MGNARRNVRPIKKVKKAVAVVDNQIKTLEPDRKSVV